MAIYSRFNRIPMWARIVPVIVATVGLAAGVVVGASVTGNNPVIAQEPRVFTQADRTFLRRLG